MNDQLALKQSPATGVQIHHADPMLAMIERVILDPNLPMERISSLLDIRERQMAKEAEQAFNAAFAAAMADMTDVPRTGENKHLGRKYSTLDDLIRTARPVLSKHGLSLNWESGEDADRIWVRAIVRHALGHSISTQQTGPRDKSGSMNVLQGGGSTETYLKRYTGFAILGLSSGDETDDDGQGNGSVELISEDQFRELSDLIAQAGIDEDVVLTAEKITALHFLPAKRFSHVRGRLMQSGKKASH